MHTIPSKQANPNNALSNAQNYYGKELKTNADLKTTACCTSDSVPEYLKPLLANIDEEVHSRFYGCGSPIPQAIEGRILLDLGCGTGRDVFLASQLVGAKGFVHGVDATDEQLELAQRKIQLHMDRFGYSEPNVAFHKGDIEDLSSLQIEDSSIDVVISNCVINLASSKRNVFREIFRVLKPGGELHFSDVFASRRIPAALQSDPVLHGECLSGALYIEDFRRMLFEIGVPDYRILSRRKIEIGSNAIREMLAGIDFYSITVRAFKLDDLEDRCEDYGQIATYLGNLKTSPAAFKLDDHHTFESGKPERVCGNTAAMLGDTRFAPYFEIIGSQKKHFGLFPCSPTQSDMDSSIGGCC